MKIGIKSEAFFPRYSFEEGLERICALGYDGVDYSALCPTETEIYQVSEKEFEKRLTAERRGFEKAGLPIYQIHGPWRWPSKDDTPEDRAERFEKMSKAIRGAAFLGCPNMVIHNIMPFGRNDPEPDVTREINRDFMTRLADYGKEYGVTVCMENMPFPNQCLARPAVLREFVGSINHPNLRMCLDTGHAAVHGISAGESVRVIGKEYLYALHIHDNNGFRDLHWPPYTGVVDWEDFARAIAEIGFDGYLSLEADIPATIPAEEYPAHEAALANTAKKIAATVDRMK